MRELRILDWKSGRGDASHGEQLRGYAFLGLQRHPDCDLVRVCTVRVREQTAEWASYTRAELKEWWQSLVARTQESERFTAGKHCGFCPRAATCQARLVMLGGAIETMRHGLPESPRDLATLLDACGMVERLAKHTRELIKAAVLAAGGSLRCEDGRELFIEHEERKAVDVAAGWPHLADALHGTQPLVRLLSVGKGELEKAVREANGKGRIGGAAWKELLARLEAAGAMETTYQESLNVRRSATPVAALENHA